MDRSSDRKKRGFLPPQSQDEILLMRKVEELCRQAYYTQRVRFTNFLSDRQQELAQAAVNKAGAGACRWEGGYPDAERKILVLLAEPEQLFESPLCCVSLQPISKTAALQHRDCLGAILGLGLDRKSVGDILLQKDGSAVVFCLAQAAELMQRELSQIGRETVFVSQYDFEQQPLEQSQQPLRTATVASLRLDAVLAAMLHCSREKAAQAIRSTKVEINHCLTESVHTPLYEQDLITVRGLGRFRLQTIGGKSRKDRIFIEYYQY